MRISDWSSDVVSSDLRGGCTTDLTGGDGSVVSGGGGGGAAVVVVSTGGAVVVVVGAVVVDYALVGAARWIVGSSVEAPAPAHAGSEERRVGAESVSKCRYREQRDYNTKKTHKM